MANMRDFPQYTAGGTLTKNSEYAEGQEKTFGGNLGENSEYANSHEINFRREFGAKIANMRKVTKYTFGVNLP